VGRAAVCGWRVIERAVVLNNCAVSMEHSALYLPARVGKANPLRGTGDKEVRAALLEQAMRRAHSPLALETLQRLLSPGSSKTRLLIQGYSTRCGRQAGSTLPWCWSGRCQQTSLWRRHNTVRLAVGKEGGEEGGAAAAEQAGAAGYHAGPEKSASAPENAVSVRAGQHGWCSRSAHPAPPARSLRRWRRSTAQALTLASQ